MFDAAEVQATVDELAAAIGLPVLVEDERHLPISWSAQGDVDGTRRRTILERTVSPAAIEMVARLRLAQAHGPVRTPEVPEADMRARWCVPLRDGHLLLGYLWVLDGDGKLPEADLPFLTEAGRCASSALAEGRRSTSGHLRERLRLLERLLAGGDDDAVGGLIALERLDPATTVVVQAPGRPGGWELPDEMTAHIHQPGTRHRAPGPATSGPPLPLADLRLVVVRAAQTRTVIRAGGELATPSWEALGAWHLVVDAPPGLAVHDIHPGADVLARLPKSDLLTTARAVLEHGGDIAATAAELHVHRTTLHYRLDRIEALIGMDLRWGASRADLLMALRLEAYRRAGG